LELAQYFILDEADRMLDLGFMGDVKRLVDTMPSGVRYIEINV
jgi:superfamily II DNA/RNA helicase